MRYFYTWIGLDREEIDIIKKQYLEEIGYRIYNHLLRSVDKDVREIFREVIL